MNKIQRLAEKFSRVFYEREWPGRREPSVSRISIEEAYAVQDLVAGIRTQKGERVAGYKVGCTSDAIRSQFGLEEPISARIFEPYIHQEGSISYWNEYAACAVEPEMVITIGADLFGAGLTDDQLTGAIECVHPGIELHNYRFWFHPPTSQELICSGGIHAGLIVGEALVPPEELSFEHELFRVRMNGELITEAPASEIMGGPLHSLRWLVDSLTSRGLVLQKGSLVIPGSPVELVRIDRDVELSIEIEGVGKLTTHFERRL